MNESNVHSLLFRIQMSILVYLLQGEKWRTFGDYLNYSNWGWYQLVLKIKTSSTQSLLAHFQLFTKPVQVFRHFNYSLIRNGKDI